MSEKKDQDFDPTQKVAILLLGFGEDVASELIKKLPQDQAKRVLLAMQKLGKVNQNIVDKILLDFHSQLSQNFQNIQGGYQKAVSLIQNAFKGKDSQEFLDQLSLQRNRFDFLKSLDPKSIANLISSEHVQVVTVVLSFLDASLAGQVLKLLDKNFQVEYLLRLAKLETVSFEFLDDVEEVLEKKAKQLNFSNAQKVGGVQNAAKLLAGLDATMREQLLENLRLKNEIVHDDISKHLFTFDDLIKLPQHSFEILLKHIDKNDLILALKISSDAFKQKLFSVMSERAVAILKEDLESSPKVRRKDVEKAQDNIVQIALELGKSGQIILEDDGEYV